jgi:ATP-dependent Clp protease ATP-binding subunit ClpX
MDMANQFDWSNIQNNPMFRNFPFMSFGTPGTGNTADPETNSDTTKTSAVSKDTADVSGSETIDSEEKNSLSAADANQVAAVNKERADVKVQKDQDEEEQDDQKDTSEESGKGKRPSVSFLNLGDLFGGGFGGQQQPKVKKKKKTGRKPVFSIDNIPAPHKIKEELDKYVIGQEHAKKVISVAAYNHYKRVKTGTMDEIEIEKSNILLLGPTGSGKTYIVRTLAELLDVPLAITDATSLTEAGYIGDDIESVISKLLAEADNDVEKTEKGIVFIDEIDKIAKKRNFNSRDVSGESVQQGMLKLLEGADVEVPVGANSKNAMVPLTTINTRNILFICGGAFPDLEQIVRERLMKKASIGFSAEIKGKYDNDKNILDHVTTEDLRKFGMIPEFLGRLPIVCALQGLDEDMLVKILKEPKNAILKQYQKLLALDEVKLEFEDDALHAIAKKALEKDTGARALRSIIEDFMLDIMYEIPKDVNIGTVTITKEYVEGTGGPRIEIRSDRVEGNKPLALPENTDHATAE